MVKETNGSLYPELSYEVIGACFDAFNELGAGLREKHYEAGCARALKQRGIQFARQVHCPIRMKTQKICDQFIDILISNKIVVELKVAVRFTPEHFEQINAYLRATNCRLGLLVRFDDHGVTVRRVANLYPYIRKPNP